MPGLSFLFDFSGNALNFQNTFSSSLDSVLHSQSFFVESIHEDSHILLGATRYTEYPVSVYPSERYTIFIEGRIYGKSQSEIEHEMIALADLLFDDFPRGRLRLREWLIGTDGEFIVLIRRNESGEVILFNDLLGHLPLYCYNGGEWILLSREIGFFQSFLPSVRPDQMAMAQYLLFAFPLGERTLLENVYRHRPATVIRCRPADRQPVVETLFELNFERDEHAGKPLNVNVDNLISILQTACRVRADQAGRNVVSLSGGLDSRAVAGSLYRNSIPFQAATFMDHRRAATKDVEGARIIADILGAPWTRIDLAPPRGRDAYRLLDLKHGLNYMSMRFIIPYFESIVSRFGPAVSYFTGNTGMCLRSYTPAHSLRSPGDAARYILSKGGKFFILALFSLKEAAAVTGITKEHILEGIEQEIAKYPEQSADRKFTHFMFSGYCFNWHYEGIDMQRNFLWQAAPLEATQFFQYGIGCPDEQKMVYRLYRAFITTLSPETAGVDNATWNSSIHSRKTRFSFLLRSYYNRLPSAVKGTVRKMIRTIPRYAEDSPLIGCIREQIRVCPEILEYYSLPELDSLLKRVGKPEFDTIFTLTSLIEDSSLRRSSLTCYQDSIFE